MRNGVVDSKRPETRGHKEGETKDKDTERGVLLAKVQPSLKPELPYGQ